MEGEQGDRGRGRLIGRGGEAEAEAEGTLVWAGLLLVSRPVNQSATIHDRSTSTVAWLNRSWKEKRGRTQLACSSSADDSIGQLQVLTVDGAPVATLAG